VDIKKELSLEKIISFDGFAGSGVVSRYLKQHSSKVYSNDLELYSHLITKSYLTNSSEIDFDKLRNFIHFLNENKKTTKFGVGVIEKLYAPKNTNDIKTDERCFFTNENAKIIDNIRRLIDTHDIDSKYKELALANLLHKVSVHTNTSGVFKGFYKSKTTGIGKFGGDGENALSRIMGEISLELNIFSNYDSEYEVFNGDINDVIKNLPKVNVAYYDPPYNQHPYGSNYHILNTVLTNNFPKKLSNVSGIPKDWNKSEYNYKERAEKSLEDLICHTKADFILLSYNNEGIIPQETILNILGSYGHVELRTKKYNAFRGSRNLHKRSDKVEEFLYVLKKE
jgi:adenine-specific DNA-methyltransferase